MQPRTAVAPASSPVRTRYLDDQAVSGTLTMTKGDHMRRWSGIAGIVWVVLAFGSRLVRGSVPDPSSKHATQKMADFFATKTHQSHALTGAVLGLLGLFFFAWSFLRWLRTELVRDLAFAGIGLSWAMLCRPK